MSSALGVLGGTFDPIHYGHLRMAEELASALSLEEVRFIPAGQPPHRASPRTEASHRLEMTRLAITGNPLFVLDDREVRKPQASYTVDTLTSLRQELGNNLPIWLLMGSDAFLGLSTWKNWKHLFDLANIAVAHRPGFALLQTDSLNAELRQELEKRLVSEDRWEKGDGQNPETAHPSSAGSVLLKPVTQLDISATAIRQHMNTGAGARYLLPEAVLAYIQQFNLYSTA